MPWVRDRQLDIGAALGGQTLQRIRVGGPRLCQRGRQRLETLDRNSGQQPGCVAEVVAGRRVRHTGAPGYLSQREPGWAPLGNQFGGRILERPGQVSVVVAVARGHGRMFAWRLVVVKFSLDIGNLPT